MKKIVVLYLVLGLSRCAFAGTPTVTVYGEEVVVTATRDTQEIRKIPANITVITAQEIEESGATSLVDVLEGLSSIHFRTFSGNASQSQIDMRGFGDNGFGRTLVMLDGRRLNNPDMAGINWLQIPLANVERIEVVRGANSVLYGDNAVSGVINIITQKGGGKPKVNLSTITGVDRRTICCNDGVNDGRLSITGAKGKFSYAFNGEYQSTDGYRERTKFSNKGIGLNLGGNFNDYLNISLETSFGKIEYQMPGGLTKSQMEQNRRQAINQKNDAKEDYQNLNLGLKTVLAKLGRFDINYLYGKKKKETNMDSWYSWSNPTIETLGITPKYIWERDVLGKTNKVILGLDHYYETLKLDKFSDRDRATKTSVADLEKNSFGCYINDEFNLREDIILSAGMRREKATIKAQKTDLSTAVKVFDGKKDHKGNAFNMGLTYLMGQKSKVFAKYATLYRYPFTDEQASYYGWGDTFLTDLEAEKGKNFEAGGEFYPIKNLKTQLTLFRIDMEDEISYDNVTRRNKNLDKTRHQGVELSAFYKLKEAVNIYCNYTYTNAEFTAGINKAKRLPLVPSQKVILGTEIFLPHNLSLCSDVNYTSESYLGNDYDNNNPEKLLSYTLVDLLVRYRPQIGSYKLGVFIGGENILNEKYSTMGYDGGTWSPNSYYPSPEREVKAGLSFAF
ncbi:TonB-dependent receptor [bacterium]|nr:TonB-dependent receptor [bacterium]MBU1599147.1 TonB-dependent receptor [bacterium]